MDRMKNSTTSKKQASIIDTSQANIEVDYKNQFMVIGVQSPTSALDTNRMQQENLPVATSYTV